MRSSANLAIQGAQLFELSAVDMDAGGFANSDNSGGQFSLSAIGDIDVSDAFGAYLPGHDQGTVRAFLRASVAAIMALGWLILIIASNG